LYRNPSFNPSANLAVPEYGAQEEAGKYLKTAYERQKRIEQ
jgi:hypothetical protein